MMNICGNRIKCLTKAFLSGKSAKNYGTSANQIAKAMKKLSVLGKSGKKKGWHDPFVPSKPFAVASPRESSKQGLRRINVLNKLFMRNITDLMATGEISQELLGKGIQISRVKVTPDFNIVNVFWVATGMKSDLEIEKTLKRASGLIKHELSELRVMGVVPHITFVRDKQLAVAQEVEQLLKIADYPEDYNPTETSERLRDEFELHTSLSKDLVEKIKAIDSKEEHEIDETPLPEMQHNVFGLNQDIIMKKISNEKEKIRSAWEQYEIKESLQLTPTFTNESKIKNSSDEDDEVKARFKKYLESKEFIKKDRKRKDTSMFDPYQDGLSQDFDETIYFYDEDYLEDDDLSKKGL